MRKMNMFLCASLLLLLALFSWDAKAQSKSFIPVEGANLASKMEAAIRQGNSAATQQRFWTAYAFDVRPGVAIDFEIVDDQGNVNIFEGMTGGWFSGVNVIAGGKTIETRSLGVFLLRARDTGEVVRVDVYNLERPREYSSYPVYWLGRAANDESLSLLKGLVDSSRLREVAGSATKAIALHDDRRVEEMLESIVRTSTAEGVREQAISWLGRTPGGNPARQSFLLDLARNERESTDIRRHAVAAFGYTKDAATLASLQALYAASPQQDLKRTALSSIAANDSRDASNFLIKVAGSDPNMEMRKKALSHLGGRAGQQSLGALADTVEQPDAETELQRQAVAALGRRPKDEAVPLLIKIARTHRKPEVRREALRLLGRTGDERALELFREILLK